MKLNKIFKISMSVVAFVAFAACNNAEYSAIKNLIYIDEAIVSGGATRSISNQIVEGGDDFSLPLHVRLAQPADKDINIRLALAPRYIDEYNETYEGDYVPLPEEYYVFDGTATIKAGSVRSNDVALTIKPYEVGANPYALAVEIVETDSDISLAQHSSHILYTFSKANVQVVPSFNRNQQPTDKSGTDWGISTVAFTLEFWVYMNDLGTAKGEKNNQSLFTNVRPDAEGYINEMYIRFGDGQVEGNKINSKWLASGEVTSNATFSTHTWYHLAFVRVGNVISLYINGEKDTETDLNNTNPVLIDNIMLCDSGSWFVATDCRIAQLRLWSKSLSQNALKDGMAREIDPNSAGLEGYWKMNEGSGNVFYDSTPNGRHLTCQPNYNPTWKEEVNFNHPNS